MRRHLLLHLLPAALLASGCMVQNSKDKLKYALLSYSNAIRWGTMDRVAEHVSKDKREEVLTRRREFGELKVTNCEVGTVTFKGKEKALAMVRINWYLISSLKLRTSFIEQRWENKEGKWQIVAQRLVRGAPYPLLVNSPKYKQFQKQQMWPEVTSYGRPKTSSL